MDTTQKAYAVALADFESAKDIKQDAMKEYNYLLESGDDDGYCVISSQVETQLDYWPKFEALKGAERAMVNWALEAVKTCPAYALHAEYLKDLAPQARRHPHIWTKLVELSFHLSV